jgi:hypothetical protein
LLFLSFSSSKRQKEKRWKETPVAFVCNSLFSIWNNNNIPPLLNRVWKQMEKMLAIRQRNAELFFCFLLTLFFSIQERYTRQKGDDFSVLHSSLFGFHADVAANKNNSANWRNLSQNFTSKEMWVTQVSSSSYFFPNVALHTNHIPTP